MKIISSILLLASAIVAQAQTATNVVASYVPTALVYTNAFADNATNTTPSGPLDLRRYEEIGWQISKQLSGSGTGTDYFEFEYSLDCTNWPGTYFYTVSLAANGTNRVQTNLTMNVGTMGYVRLSRARFANNSGSYPTNVTLLYTAKPFVRR